MRTSAKIFSGILCMGALLPGQAMASYHSTSDAGVERLDYIENERRAARQNIMTEEQEQLLRDAKDMEAHLRFPLDPAKASPIAFEGDDLFYDQETGEFRAVGLVHILQMEKRRFDAETGLQGNVKEQRIEVPGKLHVLQMTDRMPRVTLDGWRATYRYGEKTGSMEDASGKVDRQYVRGKRFEFYPDRIVIFDGTATKVKGENPSYYWKADRIEIQNNQKVVMENVGFYLFGKLIYKRNHYESTMGDKKSSNFPRIGYNDDNGAWIQQNLHTQIAPHLRLDSRLYASKAQGGRSRGELVWENRDSSYTVAYGYYEDSDNRWLKRAPSFLYRYGRELGDSPYRYSISQEYGRWEKGGIHSDHGHTNLYLSHDRIKFGAGWELDLGAGYSITRESYDSSRVHGWSFDSVLLRDFDERWAAYLGYHYTKNNAQNSIFDYDVDDYSSKIETGFSYRMDGKNRFVVGTEIDTASGRRKKMDYYWYHDFADYMQFILRYKEMENRWHIDLEFIPW